MELRQLRYFVSIAGLGSFTAAANTHYVAQPALSQQISKLESELGTKLFLRGPQGVTLTQTGEILLARAIYILELIEITVDEIRQQSEGETGSVRVGFVGSSTASVLTTVHRIISQKLPRIKFSFSEIQSGRQIEKIRNRVLDIGIVRQITETPDIEVFELFSEKYVLATSHTDCNQFTSQFTSEGLDIESLSQASFVMFPRRFGQRLYDDIMSVCGQLGFTPNTILCADTMNSILALVAAGAGVSIVPESASRIRSEGLRFIPLPGVAARTKLFLASRTREDNPSVRMAVSMIKEMCREH